MQSGLPKQQADMQDPLIGFVILYKASEADVFHVL
jgi:hypothetical protein